MKLFSKNMLQQALPLFFLISYMMLYLLPFSIANPNVYVQCSELNFTSSTPYESNVNSLFTSLADSASQYNFNKFETSPKSDVVYGLFQCRGDLSSPNCKDCVVNATSQLKTTCPMSKGGEIQLDECFVKYDDTSFFGTQNKMEVCKKCGPSIGYNSDLMSHIDSALAYLVGGNGQYFRGGDFGSIQGVAQCVQDLSLSDCQDCLSEASGRLRSECEASTWGDMYLGKCYIRYAEQGNLNIPNDKGNPKSNKKSAKGNKKSKLWWSLGIIFSFIGGGITFTVSIGALCVCNCWNINVYKKKIRKLESKRKSAKKERDAAKSDAKAAKEKVIKLEKELEVLRKCPSVPIITSNPCPNYIPLPPPCPFFP